MKKNGITPDQALRGGSEFARALMASDLANPEFQQEGIEKPERMSMAAKAAAGAFVSALRNVAVETVSAAMSVIAKRHTDDLIELVPLTINPDQTVEQMVSGLPHNNNLTSHNFPNCKNGKMGEESEESFLIRVVKSGWMSTKNVEKAIAKAGFVPADLPELTVLGDYADELWNAGVKFITSLGASSRWRGPCGVQVGCLSLDPGRRFSLCSLGLDWDGDDWFVVRRK